MPLHGEAARPTYTGHAKIASGVWVARHAILGGNCIQKTYAPAGREDAIAFAEPRFLNELDHPTSHPFARPSSTPTSRVTSRS